MEIRPLTDNCSEVFRRKDHICFGISPFNSLFSVEYLESLIDYAQKNFSHFHFFIPDEPTVYTLEAMGYDPEEARKKMRKQTNWLKNKMIKALSARVPTPDKYILDWQTLSSNKVFSVELDHVFQAFDVCRDFRGLCLESSRWVLQNKIESDKITDECLLKAVKYFLSEIPIFAATDKIVFRESSLFCYHDSIPFHEQLYLNQLMYKPSPGQGFGKILL